MLHNCHCHQRCHHHFRHSVITTKGELDVDAHIGEAHTVRTSVGCGIGLLGIPFGYLNSLQPYRSRKHHDQNCQ